MFKQLPKVTMTRTSPVSIYEAGELVNAGSGEIEGTVVSCKDQRGLGIISWGVVGVGKFLIRGRNC